MELVLEIFLEIYIELMFLIVPEKNVGKKQILIAKIMAVCVLLVFAALVIWGMVLIADYNNMWGIAPIVVVAALSLVQIIVGLINYKKHH